MHQPATLVELSQLDGRQPELFGQIRYGNDRLLVARQKDEAATFPRLGELIPL
jgi:hypothetical protein